MESKWSTDLLEKRITCSKGDITESGADAVVNAANNHLWMGAGVAGAIKRKGGDEIEREAVAKGPIPVGEAVATTAGNLEARYVIHAAAMGHDLRTDETKIANATRNALLRAEELKLKSIAFPALGTGVGGFPSERAAKIMVSEARRFLRKSQSVLEVSFVLFDGATFEIFNRELDV
jgi:O-acetyl-ADP-ribose deacetylase (regulator of RNase III)